LIDEQKNKGTEAESTKSRGISLFWDLFSVFPFFLGSDASSEGYASTWSSLTSGAASLWQKATEATTDIITSIKEPGEEDFKFPRPAEYNSSSLPPKPSSSNGRNYNDDSANSSKDISLLKSTSFLISWDSLSDMQDELRKPPKGSKSSTPTQFDNEATNSLSQMSLADRGKNSHSSSPVILSRNTSGGSLSAQDQGVRTGSPNLTGIATSSPARNSPSIVSGSSSKPSSNKNAPVGDDFFSTFGV
jgi:hypothetical protein